MDKSLEARYLALYKECFPEDSEKCTEIMFGKLNACPLVYISEKGEMLSALRLVPKKLFYANSVTEIPHVVGLGTLVKYRHKGYAAALLKKTFALCREKGFPFITLYPFSHDFYRNFSFATVSYDYPRVAHTDVTADVNDLIEIYDAFHENLDYGFVRKKEDFVFYKAIASADGKDFFFTADGGYLSPDEYLPASFFTGSAEGVMARIANLPAALALTKASLPFPIKVTDRFCSENNLVFSLDKGKIIPCDGYDLELDIADLTSACFGKNDLLRPYFPEKKGYLADKY